MSSHGMSRLRVRGAFRPPSTTPLPAAPSLSHAASPSVNPRRANTRWTDAMDLILIDTLIEETVSGGRSSYNGWKTTALQHVVDEVNLKVLRPDLPPITKDNVRSRLKTMKTTYNNAKSLISLSGFSYDPETFCITGDPSAWDEYIAAHPDAATYRGKPLPYYNDWAIIVGNDTATGAGSLDGFETAPSSSPMAPRTALDDIDEDGNIESGTGGSSYYVEEDVPHFDPSPRPKRAKTKLTDIQEMNTILKEMAQAGAAMAAAMTSTNYGELYRVLNTLTDLTQPEVITAYNIFSSDKEGAKAFLGCPDDKVRYGIVHLKLYGTLPPPPTDPPTYGSATNDLD